MGNGTCIAVDTIRIGGAFDTLSQHSSCYARECAWGGVGWVGRVRKPCARAQGCSLPRGDSRLVQGQQEGERGEMGRGAAIMYPARLWTLLWLGPPVPLGTVRYGWRWGYGHSVHTHS